VGFDFTKEWILENSEVTLRPLEIAHAAELHGISDDPVIWAYLMEQGQTFQDLDKYITCAVEERKNRVSYPFVVIDKPTGRIAGTTRLYEMNQTLGSVKVGHTWYGASFRGSGINTAVKCLLFEFVFER